MTKGEALIYLDKTRPKKSGKCSVKIKITYNRKRKYFNTGIDLTPKDFEAIMYGQRKNRDQKEILIKLNHFLEKANSILNELFVFSFDIFSEKYLEEQNTRNHVSFAFDKYVQQLKEENRFATAESYQYAKKSLENFKKGLTFADITPAFLRKYENWMLENGKSISTVGIYIRSFRTIYNLQNIDKNLYPFGESGKKYSIPVSRNIKKALSLEEIGKIYNYQAPNKSTKDMAKDYWIFLYLCNGLNVKDFCLLRWNNIDGDLLTYKREKTKRSKKESRLIEVALKTETLEIIKKWGKQSDLNDDYIFPHLKKGMTLESQRSTFKQLTKTINKYIKQIAFEVNINKEVTTYFARHSFATVLKRSGASTEVISELLGHSNVGVTESYLDSFPKEYLQETTDVLTTGFSKSKLHTE